MPNSQIWNRHKFPIFGKRPWANSGDQAFTKWRLAETTETAPLKFSICSADPNSWDAALRYMFHCVRDTIEAYSAAPSGKLIHTTIALSLILILTER